MDFISGDLGLQLLDELGLSLLGLLVELQFLVVNSLLVLQLQGSQCGTFLVRVRCRLQRQHLIELDGVATNEHITLDGKQAI